MGTEFPEDPQLARLIAAHPLLFRGKPPKSFSHLPAGWFAIVDRLCSDIEAELGQEGCASFSMLQIKEKFATLRLYYSLAESRDVHIDAMIAGAGRQHLIAAHGKSVAIDRVRDLVGAASAASAVTCDMCGQPGASRDMNWERTLCEMHFRQIKPK
jgi:hypothetical protein